MSFFKTSQGILSMPHALPLLALSIARFTSRIEMVAETATIYVMII